MAAFMGCRVAYLYDGSILRQEHVQSHGSSMEENIYVGTRQNLCLLLQGLACMKCQNCLLTALSCYVPQHDNVYML